MRKRALVPFIALVLGLGVAASASAALTPTITSFPSSAPVNPESHPGKIAAGADGALWFTDPYADKIGRMTTAGVLTLQAPTNPTTFAYDIAQGGDGGIWFVSQGPSSVSRIDAAGNILTKALANPTANPTDIVSGPDGAIWFTEAAGKAIGRIPAATPLATPEETRLTTGGPNGIATGPDGRIWFVQYSESNIGRMELDGKTTYFPLPKGIENPESIVPGPDGALWVTTLNPGTFVRITTDGDQRTFPLPAELFPDEIAIGADGALWFAGGDKISRLTMAGEVESFPLPKGVGVQDVAAGADGNLWFTQTNAGLIGRITTPPTATTGAGGPVGARKATVAGSVSGHSQTTAVRVEYGPRDGVTTTSPPVSLAASAAAQPVSLVLDGLQPSTAYRYRLVATNPTGSGAGDFASLTTAPAPLCTIARTKRRKAGKVAIGVTCTATDSVTALVTARKKGKKGKKGKKLVYGSARAQVTDGKAQIRIKPRKKALAVLRARKRLRLTIQVTASGGGTTSIASKKLLVKAPRRP